MAAKRFPVRWWLTTGLAAVFIALFAVGVYAKWSGIVMPFFVVGVAVILWFVERRNERERDVDQIWWVPSRVLWATPLRVVATLAMTVGLFAIAGLLVFGEVGTWLLWVAVAGMVVYRLTLGRRWLKHDRAAVAAADAPEG